MSDVLTPHGDAGRPKCTAGSGCAPIGLDEPSSFGWLNAMNGKWHGFSDFLAAHTSFGLRVGARALALWVGLGTLTIGSDARADAYGITHPGRHIDYVIELEPEVILAFDRAFDDGPGLGLRASVPVMFNGFVSSINNSVALTFGFDKDPFADGNHYYVPVALQWNFWLHHSFSVFAEPGMLLAFSDKARVHPEVWGGARLHFNDWVSLTGRVSVPSSPAIGLGVSFFF